LLEWEGTTDNDKGMGTGPGGINAATKHGVVKQGALPKDKAPALVGAGYSV
jgi:hypothetical protein